MEALTNKGWHVSYINQISTDITATIKQSVCWHFTSKSCKARTETKLLSKNLGCIGTLKRGSETQISWVPQTLLVQECLWCKHWYLSWDSIKTLARLLCVQFKSTGTRPGALRKYSISFIRMKRRKNDRQKVSPANYQYRLKKYRT